MMPSLDSARASAARVLRDRGIGTAALDARALLTAATGLSLEALIAKGREPLGPAAGTRFQGYVARRLAGEPVSRIRGTREFYGRDFRIGPQTLDPRPDTETLVAAVLDIVGREARAGRPLRILDLGTGSGCILTTLLAELPDATGVGADISPGALRLARANAESVGVADRARFAVSDWFEALAGRYDIIVSNPPYIASDEIGGLAPEVAEHDPLAALDGGPDGLDAYRRIAAGAPAFLVPGGHLLVEIGCTQGDAVTGLFERAGLAVAEDGIVADLAGHPRCVCARTSEA
ncbi:peptide chain release factor N(5)-glutamine methyltransferase [Methyloceanibacter sp.]|uniref:peptide chain release factor N(5)-glutamine methyltransferase n=1 Tax=Methyloceanibacter sp. TaxID=1965321 RepID=UPI002B5A9D96|nr:peptide chain release factor N(5)-glutamine methyltransferase [Methyloceanibacter sp.]HML93058.1 peptide chain release factor N(5)-glutamine methyltransferase [Methyloceanibacter sp.]